MADWNARYSRGEETYSMIPSEPLARAVAGVPPGLALDLASGAGRHALFLAERGWRVVAVDGAAAGVALMMAEAARRGVAAAIEPRVADLEASPRQFMIVPESYDLICDFYYLERALFDEIRDGVRPGGRFVAAIHVDAAQGAASHGFLLGVGELERTARGWGWEILHSQEGASTETGHEHATAELICRRPL